MSMSVAMYRSMLCSSWVIASNSDGSLVVRLDGARGSVHFVPYSGNMLVA